MKYKEPTLNLKTMNDANFSVSLKFLHEKTHYTKTKSFYDEDDDEVFEWERKIEYDEPLKVYEATIKGVYGFDLNDLIIDEYNNQFIIVSEDKAVGNVVLDSSGLFLGKSFTRIGSVFSKG